MARVRPGNDVRPRDVHWRQSETDLQNKPAAMRVAELNGAQKTVRRLVGSEGIAAEER